MPPAKPVLLTLAVANVATMCAFLLLLLLVPIRTDLDVRANFMQLDRAGVVNQAALQKFHASFGFSSPDLGYRNTVPRYVAGSALWAERRNAAFGIAITALNSLVAGGAWLWLRRSIGNPPLSARCRPSER